MVTTLSPPGEFCRKLGRFNENKLMFCRKLGCFNENKLKLRIIHFPNERSLIRVILV
jgi:hypothetical protein